MVEPLVRRAIGFAQEADAETRKRLAIRYRPKTPGELEQLRNSIGPAVRFAADPNPNPKGPVDIRSGRIAVGTKAPVRKTPAALRPAPTESASEPKSGAKRARPKAPRTPRVKSQPAINRHTGKPPRQWKPKERK
jgi:hypothetical protein